MRAPGGSPPAWLRSALGRLFPGPRGAEVLEDLDREYAALRQRSPRPVADGWYLLQLLRPASWRLAWALRRMRSAQRRAAAPAAGVAGGGAWLSGMSLDVKLAWRMLLKSPGLTVVGALGIALGTAVGVGFFVVLSTHFYPEVPLAEGERIVALQTWDAETSRAARASLEEFVAWREQLRSVEQIAAAAFGNRDLVTGDSPPRTVRVAAMTAAGFEVARVQPLVGRYLLPDDERAGAPRVAVLGYDLWQGHFGGDPGIVGRSVLVGPVQHTVVGVMPPGFAFPKSEELWTALPVPAVTSARGDGPALFVFGRLAPGATREQAQAELTATGGRTVPGDDGTDRHLRPQVVPFTHPLDDVQLGTLWQAAQVQFMVNLLLVAIAVNMAVLVYARTAIRQGEIALRAALGASRRRIVGQLLVEAFLLSALGAGLGLAAAHIGLRQLETIIGRLDGIGFWVDYGLQPRSVAFALLLAVLSALIVGVVPALKSTGRRLGADLRSLGGGVSARLGWVWTALIVAQVAVAVTVLPTALHLGFREVRMGAVRATFPAHEFLNADVGVAVPLRDGMDADDYRRETAARFAIRLPELERRLQAEPAVAGVTFEGSLAGRGSLVEVEGAPGPAELGAHRLQTRGVAAGYFDVLGARILAGRELRPADAGGPAGGVVVNEAFVRLVLGGGPVLGRQVRFLTPPTPGAPLEQAATEPWLEVVGVVEDLQRSAFDHAWAPPSVYYAVAPGQLQAARLLVHVRGGSTNAFTPRLRQVTAAVDPDFRLSAVENLATLASPRYLAAIVAAILLALGTVLLLSAAGIHALMSLAVTRRRKEIAIRTALGARAGRMLARVFARAAWQLGLGGLLGSLLGGALLLLNGLAPPSAALFLGLVIVLVLTAGLGATVGPARRGLGIQPMEALKEE